MSLRNLIRAASHYSIGSFLSTIAGIISFPILTRFFSVAEYGVMSIVAASLTILVAAGKLGLQHSTVRFRSELGEAGFSKESVASTALVSMTGVGSVVAAAWLTAITLAPRTWVADTRLRGLLMLISALVIIQIVDSALVNILRADQLSAALNAYQVAKKYVTLGLVVAALLLAGRDLRVLYLAQIGAEGLVVIALAWWLFHSGSRVPLPTLNTVSAPLLREMLRYGVPLMLGWELSGIILSVGDRYLVGGILGAESLGIYAAAYNLCQYVEAVVVAPWGLAITPIYLRVWRLEGRDATRAFVDRSLRYYIILGFPVIAGLSATGRQLLVTMASARYGEGSTVIPWVVAGLLASGAVPLAAAGLFIEKRTWIAAGAVLLSTLLNVGLNLLLIPVHGIVGAGIATFVSYACLLVLMTRAGSHYLHITFPWVLAARVGSAAIVMYALVGLIRLDNPALTLAAQIGCGCLIYGSVLLVVEPTARNGLRAALAYSEQRRS